MTTHTNGVKDTDTEVAGVLKSGTSAPIEDGQMEAQGYAEERQSDVHQNAIQVAERIESAPGRAIDGVRISAAPLAGASRYTMLESDFRSHHHTNAVRRRSPYEHYRLVYRYGYDLGTDPRYARAAWSLVEQEARPCWEERNPGTWEQCKDMIRYAWDTTRMHS